MANTNTYKAKEFLNYFNNNLELAVAALRQAAVAPQSAPVINNAPVVVSVQDVSRRYKVGHQRVQAVRNVSLQIHQGELVALTGPSGSGKSTLLHMIGGLDKPDSGQVIVNGKDISRMPDRELSRFRNKTIGFVFQFFYLQPFLSLQTNLEVPAIFARTKRPRRHVRALTLAKEVGLAERVRHLPKELSGGQMQRAAIARALFNQPSIILADEPTGNLDSVNGQAIIDLFDAVRRTYGTTIIIVTHDPKISMRADREIVLADGQVVNA